MTGFLMLYSSVAFYGLILALGALSYLFSNIAGAIL